MDTPETQAMRVTAIKAAGHVPASVRELGYERQVCEVDGSDWPCPDMAQATEWRG